VVTRLLAIVIASDDGVSAEAGKIRQRKIPTPTDKRLDMDHSTETPAVAKHKKPEFGLKRFALDQRLHRPIT
jgi:hypothetical protein